MRHIRLPRAVLILAVLLAPSCGGGGSTPSTPSNPTTTTTTVPPTTGTADLVISILGDQGGMSFSPAARDPSRRADGGLAEQRHGPPHRDAGRRTIQHRQHHAGLDERAHRHDRDRAFPYHCSLHPGMVGSLTVNP